MSIQVKDWQDLHTILCIADYIECKGAIS